MSRPKQPVPSPKRVTAVDRIKRANNLVSTFDERVAVEQSEK